MTTTAGEAGTKTTTQPLLTIAIPSYNAEGHLNRALDSVTGYGGQIEVIVVDDGSTDGTAALGQSYADRFPEVRVISKPNGGHGSAVNTGIENAHGLYLRVLDADDWLDRHALEKVLATLDRLVSTDRAPDVLVTNYVYEKVGKTRKQAIRYRGALKRNRILTWDDTHRFAWGQFLNMHSLTYRTKVLRKSGLKLPEHTFYVDMLYAFIPLTAVRTLYYLDVDFYRYLIGRENQSVQESVMIKRLDQYRRVNWMMVEYLSDHPVANPMLRKYMLHYAGIVCGVTSILQVRAGTPEALAQRGEFWDRLRAKDPKLARQLRYKVLGVIGNFPGSLGRRATSAAYVAARQVIGFN